MKNYKITKQGSESQIPDDLWAEILSRLPVKSLLRFRCISKSWLSMINHPDFCRLHLQNFKDNRDETRLLVVQGINKNCVLRCSDTFKPIAEAFHSIGQSCEEGSWRVECSIDGLVLLKNYGREVLGFHKLRVWNPSIRKFHDIPALPETEASAHRSIMDEEIGLGYDPVAKDYKNVKLIFVNDNKLHSFAVYTLEARLWEITSFQVKGCSNWRRMDITHRTTVYLRGSLYFTAYDVERRDVDLISIDLSTELFSYTNLPNDVFVDGNYLNGWLTLVDGRSTLALFEFVQGAMWVLWVLDSSSSAESEPASWIRRYSFSLEVPRFLYHKKKGDVLMWFLKDMSFRLPGGTGLSQWFVVVSAYNFEAGEEEMLQLQIGDRDVEIHHVCGYVESLNLLI